ncbi:hypothetical protein V866_007563 [Kwoniella sp. B9012]
MEVLRSSLNDFKEEMWEDIHKLRIETQAALGNIILRNAELRIDVNRLADEHQEKLKGLEGSMKGFMGDMCDVKVKIGEIEGKVLANEDKGKTEDVDSTVEELKEGLARLAQELEAHIFHDANDVRDGHDRIEERFTNLEEVHTEECKRLL